MAKKNKTVIDPEQARWNRTYPKFPGVRVCVELLKQRNIHGTWIDIIEIELTTHAAEHLEEMMTIFHAETDEWVRTMLFWPITEARLPQAFSFLLESLYSDNPQFRQLAIRGLKLLDTREARTALWEARNHSFPTEQETQDFRRLLST
jgi:hypothetical protein